MPKIAPSEPEDSDDDTITIAPSSLQGNQPISLTGTSPLAGCALAGSETIGPDSQVMLSEIAALSRAQTQNHGLIPLEYAQALAYLQRLGVEGGPLAETFLNIALLQQRLSSFSLGTNKSSPPSQEQPTHASETPANTLEQQTEPPLSQEQIKAAMEKIAGFSPATSTPPATTASTNNTTPTQQSTAQEISNLANVPSASADVLQQAFGISPRAPITPATTAALPAQAQQIAETNITLPASSLEPEQQKQLSPNSLSSMNFDQLKTMIKVWIKGKKGEERTKFVKDCFIKVLGNDPTGKLALEFYKDYGWKFSQGLMYGVEFSPEEILDILQKTTQRLADTKTNSVLETNLRQLLSRILDGKPHKFFWRTGLDSTAAIVTCLDTMSLKIQNEIQSLNKVTSNDQAKAILKLYDSNTASPQIKQRLEIAHTLVLVGSENNNSISNTTGTSQNDINTILETAASQPTPAVPPSNLQNNSFFAAHTIPKSSITTPTRPSSTRGRSPSIVYTPPPSYNHPMPISVEGTSK